MPELPNPPLDRIFDPEYWRERLLETPDDEPQKAIFETNRDNWQAIEEVHREIIRKHVKGNHSVLDVGCGWGRLLSLMPLGWYGMYLGIDISPDFISMAQSRYLKRKHQFKVADARECLKWALCPYLIDNEGGHTYFPSGVKRDWAILVSIKPMILRNVGEEVWELMKRNIKEVCNRILLLEYNIDDKGTVE